MSFSESAPAKERSSAAASLADPPPPPRASAHEVVSREVLDYIKSFHSLPWREPFPAELPRGALTGREYSGTNALLHHMHDLRRRREGLPEREPPAWLTFRQAGQVKWMENGRDRAGAILKGETGRLVVYYGVQNPGAPAEDRRLFLGINRVWNIAQTSIPREKWPALLPGAAARGPDSGADPREGYLRMEAMVLHCKRETGLSVRPSGGKSAPEAGTYRPGEDLMVLPAVEGGRGGVTPLHASAVLRGVSLAACHPGRCNVTLSAPAAALAAELCAVFLGREFRIENPALAAAAGDAADVEACARLLESDPRAFMQACGTAVNMSRYLLRFAPPGRAEDLSAPPGVTEGLKERFRPAEEAPRASAAADPAIRRRGGMSL